MSVIEYAAHRGCSDSYIRRMRRTGKLVMHVDGKRIQVVASDALLDDITDPVRGGDHSADTAAAPRASAVPLTNTSMHEAMRRERMARAQLAELALAVEAKTLIRRADVERAVFTLARKTLNELMGMSARLRSKLAAESDPRAVGDLLDAEVIRFAAEMRRGANKLSAGWGGNADGMEH
jgi:hypothetical protein